MTQTHSYSYSPGKVTSPQVTPESFFWKSKQGKLIMLCDVESADLRTGETIFLNGKGFVAEEIQIRNMKVDSAPKGASVGVHLKNTQPEDIENIGGTLLKGRRD